MRMDNLNAELSDQVYALSTISREKYDAPASRHPRA
jgi:hypothetical protein